MKTAVVLFNLGGPDSPEAIEPYLRNLFSDRDIIDLPFQKYLAKWIARRRAPRVRADYEKIGGKSSLNYWTEKQRQKLEEVLNARDGEFRVFVGMRYWHPMIHECSARIKREGFERIVLLPLYPQYSRSTTGSCFNEWDRCFQADSAEILRIEHFFEHPGFIRALNRRIDESLKRFPEEVRKEVVLLFSAHSLPEKRVREGDPYKDQVERTVRLVMEERGFDLDYRIGYQSRATPVRWVSPYTDQVLMDLAQEGRKAVVLVPVSFVSDHFETEYELQIQCRSLAKEKGIQYYDVINGLNDMPEFIETLADLVLSRLEQKRE
jgi:ferrochelatase